MGFKDGVASGSEDERILNLNIPLIGATGSFPAQVILTLAQVQLAAP